MRPSENQVLTLVRRTEALATSCSHRVTALTGSESLSHELLDVVMKLGPR